jgi:hypothetical protein
VHIRGTKFLGVGLVKECGGWIEPGHPGGLQVQHRLQRLRKLEGGGFDIDKPIIFRRWRWGLLGVRKVRIEISICRSIFRSIL